MTLPEFQDHVIAWTRDVQAEALRLFESGVHAQEAIGLAINVVESRRRKTSADRVRFALPVRTVPQ